jgi:hypothetical protein
MEDRIATLEFISGLKVTCRIEKGQHVFEFWFRAASVKTCFIYPKAKLFAEGVEFGKTIQATYENEKKHGSA